MPTQRFSLLVAYAVVLTCGGAALPPASPPITPDVTLQEKYFPPIPPPTEFDTTAERSDQRRLMVGDCPERCRPGPMAWIQPRAAAALWSEAHRDSGEVIARLISDGRYPKFKLQDRHGRPDTVYWAIVKRGGQAVSIFRSTTPGTPDVTTPTEVIPHGQGFFRGVSLARFIWSDRDYMAWGTCDGGACCKSPGAVTR